MLEYKDEKAMSEISLGINPSYEYLIPSIKIKDECKICSSYFIGVSRVTLHNKHTSLREIL